MLSLELARTTPSAAAFLARAAAHLRFALGLGESAAAVATRARYDRITGLRGAARPAAELERLPPGRGRARAACLLGVREPAPPETVRFEPPELLVEIATELGVTPDGATLRPQTEMRTTLTLAPRCDPDSLKPPAAARSTPR